jgi:hypothetical protein
LLIENGVVEPQPEADGAGPGVVDPCANRGWAERVEAVRRIGRTPGLRQCHQLIGQIRETAHPTPDPPAMNCETQTEGVVVAQCRTPGVLDSGDGWRGVERESTRNDARAEVFADHRGHELQVLVWWNTRGRNGVPALRSSGRMR